MARKATIIGTSRDFEGFVWDVRESRPTNHGFDLLLGWPFLGAEPQRGKGFGGPRIIPTRELQAYWDGNQLARDGAIYDLPAGRTALKRVRALFGFNLYLANESWWLDRLSDLADMSGADFSRKHNVCESEVSIAHKSFFGSRQRPNGWYREPSTKSLLVSGLPHAYVADQLSISMGASARLRSMLNRGLI